MKHVQKKLFREHCFSQSTETSVYNNKFSLCLTVILNYYVFIFQIIKFKTYSLMFNDQFVLRFLLVELQVYYMYTYIIMPILCTICL